MSLAFKWRTKTGTPVAKIALTFTVTRADLVEAAVIAQDSDIFDGPLNKGSIEAALRYRLAVHGTSPDVDQGDDDQWDAAEAVVTRLWPELTPTEVPND